MSVKVNQILFKDILGTYHTINPTKNIDDFRVFVEIDGELVPITAVTTKMDGSQQIIFKINNNPDIEVV